MLFFYIIIFYLLNFFFFVLIEEDVKKMLIYFDISKVCGFDFMNLRFFKEVVFILCYFLIKFFNKFFSIFYFLVFWKMVYVIFIYKKGNINDLINYCLIFFFFIIGKILE